MSSFKRKSNSKQQQPLPPGTRQCPTSPLTKTTSTGIPTLDDILGGGLPLSCTLLVLAPNAHSAYGTLVQRYFVAQGLAGGQRVCVVDDEADELVRGCMWEGRVSQEEEEEEEDRDDGRDEGLKVAWRYEDMKKAGWSQSPSPMGYCRTFDLTCTIPADVVEDGLQTKRLVYINVSDTTSSEPPAMNVIKRLAEILRTDLAPLRICIPSFGSPQWGDVDTERLLLFLYTLRQLLRKHPHACASLCMPSHLSRDSLVGAGWTQKLGWLSDAAITLDAFSADPSLIATFPEYHGLLRVHALPAPHALVPASDQLSSLRAACAGDNDLAFRCTRRRLAFDTLHLDVGGGVAERRTTPAITLDEVPRTERTPAVQVAFEETPGVTPSPNAGSKEEVDRKVKAKKGKKVSFQSELYDF